MVAVTEPATGLPSKLKWLPAIAEIVEACDAELAPILRRWQTDQQLERQRQLRLAAPERPRPSPEEVDAVLKRHGLNRMPLAPAERNDGRHGARALGRITARKARSEGDVP